MEKLHPGVKILFRLGIYFSFIFLFILFGFAFIGVAIAFGGLGLILPIFLLYLIIVAGLGEIYARLSYKYWKYEFTNSELKIEKGIIWKVYKSIPYARIQNVEIHRGIIARLLGFSTLSIQTAGYSGYSRNGRGAAAEGSIPAVSVVRAEEIRSFLMKKIGKRSGM